MLSIYKPKLEDLWFKSKMLSDTQTMSYNSIYGGTIDFPKDKWNEWYSKWVDSDDNKRYYRYLKNNDSFIGEISYHYDDSLQVYLCDVLIFFEYRNKGYGSEGLDMICEIAKSNGIDELYDDIGIDNPSISLFLKKGFQIVSKSSESIIVKKIL